MPPRSLEMTLPRPSNNTCFITECHQYCEVSKTPVCGKPDLVEGSVAAFLPQDREYRRKNLLNPWKRSYTRGTGKAKWETNSSYCYSSVMVNPPFTKGRRMLDLIDLSIFDFFIGNFDRHTYNTFFKFGDFSAIIHLDQGRSFGSYEKDELSCLAPLKQCCFVRNSTYHRLLLLNKDEYKLGDVMRESMSTDPIAPVLYEPHYEALNRRLRIIIDVIDGCLATASAADDVLKKEPRYEDYMREISHDKKQLG
ncbi:putative extracellular serine/threonine protein kinase FAM20C [Apostichopus japonicus]|uniref:Putative extracellular serine/threonine protein kinase FAM20C n=1 Tax=Stichopus japonicus TaxID=307972 RepID=A0A2G8KDN7_STIJA|nr:putative extracellular serine/threonine protein kinase FAM20C [Apostichopus japonicus]